MLTAGTPATTAARERARRALLEARRAMGGLIGEGAPPFTPATGELPAPGLERLQSYLEESERDRAALRDELKSIRATMLAMQARLDAFERPATAVIPERQDVAPAPIDAAATPSPVVDRPAGGERADVAPAATSGEPAHEDPEVRELRDRVLRALRERVFAAGTVGTKIELTPAPPEPELEKIIDRFHAEPLIEHAELLERGEESALLRVTLRTAMRWDQFSALLERTLGRPISAGEASWSQGTVRVRYTERACV